MKTAMLMLALLFSVSIWGQKKEKARANVKTVKPLRTVPKKRTANPFVFKRLDCYEVCNPKLLETIKTDVISYLVKNEYDPQKEWLVMCLDVHEDGTGFIVVGTTRKDELRWGGDDWFWGYMEICGYSFLLSEKQKEDYVRKKAEDCTKLVKFRKYGYAIPPKDGTIEWWFVSDGEKVVLERFNDVW